MPWLKDSETSDNRARLSMPNRWAVAALAVTILLVIVVRIRTLQIPLERDEGEFAYFGQLILEGIPPYKLAYNMKLPGTYASYAAIMAVFGQTPAGIHFGFLLVNLATVALLFFVARRLLDSSHAVVACVVYALLSMCSGVLGLQGHATQLVVPAALGGVLLLLKARASGRLWTFGWSGVMFGLAFVCKQPGLFFGLFGFTVMLGDVVAAGPAERRSRLIRFGPFCAGLAVPFLLTCLWMAWAGTFDRFWFWTVTYAQKHGTLLTWSDGLNYLGKFNEKAGPLQWSWVAAALGLLCLARDKARSEAMMVIGWLLVFSLLAFAAGFYFFRHYFILMLPVVSLLSAVAVRRVAQAKGEVVAGFTLSLGCAGFIAANRAMWFELSPVAICRALYVEDPFPEAVVIGKYIQEHTQPSDTVAILGSEPEIYFYAHRHSASGYIYMYDLLQDHAYALPMQKEAIRQIEAAKPAYVVLVNLDSSWMLFPNSNLTIMDWLKTYCRNNYETAGMALMLPDRTEYVWGQAASNPAFDTDMRVAILKRKPGL